ncbi:PLP-dependent aminotransferase family protein [Paenibacillus pasadenensis]|uniref:MocR-like pyridoxine biosynthesis transcription factor PdxR n=1 Tax=Paenibacillus pasadenensis TaxID=217090 RepID=UPI00203F082B|nr:PLP-dependent aminotransferase family protein [Paenibacillus pasadenensis]MCM3746852.1 PLP-dependent aminotransferase family protein [Paenibacillus pasadenensis]
MWMPDRASDKTLYEQIAEHLEQRIRVGEFPPGSLLPSERRLAEQFGVNRSTVVLAFAELRSLGLIESRSGSGTMVSRPEEGAIRRHSPDWGRFADDSSFVRNPAMFRKVREALQQIPGLIDMASGELSADLMPTREIVDIMSRSSTLSYLGYDNPQGYPPLREALVRYLQRLGIHTTDTSIIITSGSQQSLYLILRCLLSPGDAVAIEDPSYCYSLPMFRTAGLRVFRLPVDRHGVNPGDIRLLHKKHRIKMVFLNPNFQNPTGALLSNERRIQLMDLASELALPIVEDDPYSLTAFNGVPPAPLKAMDKAGSVIYIGSFSKIAASGLRIGWMVAPRSIVEQLADARQQMDFGLSVIPQQVVATFLDSAGFEPHLERLRIGLQFKRDLTVDALRHKFNDRARFWIPEGGMHLWCSIRASFSESQLLEQSIRAGFVYVPGSVHGSESGCVRLTYGRADAADIDRGIAALRQAVDRAEADE